MTYQSPPKLETTYDRLEGKVVLVTGATSGIGEAATKLFAAEGAKVVAVARRTDRLKALVRSLADQGLSASATFCDVSDERSIQTAVEFAVTQFGRLDLAFNNAGVGAGQAPVHLTETNTFDRAVRVNLRGVFLCMKYEIEAMLEHGEGGAIVNTSSIGGLIGAPNMAAYSASKWGLAGLTKCAALDYADRNIRINAIAPAATHSEMLDGWLKTESAREAIAASSPMNYIADPDDMARAALYLLSDEARWTTGIVLPCDGGTSAGINPRSASHEG